MSSDWIWHMQGFGYLSDVLHFSQLVELAESNIFWHIIYQNWSTIYVQFRHAKIFEIGCMVPELQPVKVSVRASAGTENLTFYFYSIILTCYISKHIYFSSRVQIWKNFFSPSFRSWLTAVPIFYSTKFYKHHKSH